ncbi:LapA family protein [Pontixanthobacter aestiaquae]|uniref:LapA family protein n=1 Tax=Pontixanthobacter aestiaquae TaxID=1509367 RepID=A0A844ZDK1_9SPHN|nr:LapA family protein [Pontixanthobacter aestiaquae]MDN3645141.1 LapA family protein [Pontixanthobacter aestiaquae]MXO83859.1 LapA family protein [Pontixanthobacter aestiaquae]
MRIVRTILWIILAVVVTIFVYVNWGESHNVIIWPREGGKSILFDWPVGFIAIVFFLAGFLPMWLFHRGVKWRLNRRIKTLENAAHAAAVSPPVQSAPTPVDPTSVESPDSAEKLKPTPTPSSQP